MNIPPSTEYDFMMFNQLKASGIHIHLGTIGETAGIFDLGLVWKDRILKLQADLEKTTNGIEKSTLKSRIKFLSESSGLVSRFVARMLYSVWLARNLVFQDPVGYLLSKPAFNPENNKPDDWSLEFWCGGWGADALSGYIDGYLEIPMHLDSKSLLNADIN